MHFSLVKISPQDTAPPNGFDDVILPLSHAFRRLGFNVETRCNALNPASVNIIFGAGIAPENLGELLPKNSVIFNLEQLTTRKTPWNNPRYIELMRRFTVWDYSRRNARYLRKSRGLSDVVHLRLGYVPEMTRLNPEYPQTFDVLFYGTINERRRKIIEDLRSAGANVFAAAGIFGTLRDRAIAAARLALNVHYYIPATLEMPRLGYLWANNKTVVSERKKETEIEPGLEESCRFCAYEDLVGETLSLLRSARAREMQARAGFAAFAALRQEDFLEAVVGRAIHASGPVLPGTLNAGSGKDFRQDCLNVDLNPAMNPDLVLDLSLPLEGEREHSTLRFGDIRLRPGAFKRVIAIDLLEHIRDLPTLMRNFLDLLTDGGELEIVVPYELSVSAWQDPTHVRAFNERSWIYYCEWAWYLGWREARFSTQSVTFAPGAFGKSLEERGVPGEEMLRTPRAVDSMRVILRKRAATLEEQLECDVRQRSFYKGAVGEWSL
ncbi:MAG: class I SAM-dependent methyltransferase [Desulfovibrio sp.]|jgi:SAM-dependent methyltransferase|nr:class I SAM-dependent methyltransferase [Desulfovibrio sp.]